MPAVVLQPVGATIELVVPKVRLWVKLYRYFGLYGTLQKNRLLKGSLKQNWNLKGSMTPDQNVKGD